MKVAVYHPSPKADESTPLLSVLISEMAEIGWRISNEMFCVQFLSNQLMMIGFEDDRGERILQLGMAQRRWRWWENEKWVVIIKMTGDDILNAYRSLVKATDADFLVWEEKLEDGNILLHKEPVIRNAS